MKKTKGQIEAQISEAMIQFEKEYMGRGPTECRTYIIDDILLVRLKGVLTPAEQRLAKSAEGRELVKKIRANLLEQARTLLMETIEQTTSVKVASLYTDISTDSGERVILFMLSENLEKKFRNHTA